MNKYILFSSVSCLLCCIAAIMLSGCDRSAADSQTLNLYIWGEYMPQSVLDEFTERTGYRVVVDTYDSNETLLQKLQSGVAGYDLCVPSDYMIEILIAENLIQKVDRDRLTNLGNLDERFLGRSFDPEDAYSVPYLWGTTGFGYNKQVITGTVDSWDIFFDPQYGGKILMLDDMRECFAVALKSMGQSLNTRDETILRAAADRLKQQKQLVRTYNSDDYDNILAAGDVVLSHGYNGQFAKLVAEEPEKFAYVVPKQGATIWADAMCIPASARNVEAATAFLNFILEPRVAAAIVNHVHYASANRAAQAHVNAEILDDPAIYPPAELLEHGETMEDIGAATTLMDRLWTEIKAQ